MKLGPEKRNEHLAFLSVVGGDAAPRLKRRPLRRPVHGALPIAVATLAVWSAGWGTGLRADDVVLVNGAVFEDVIAITTPTHVAVVLPIGRIELPRSQVLRIVEKKTRLQEFGERRAALIENMEADAGHWLTLAAWAERSGLQDEAIECALFASRLRPDLAGLAALLWPAGFDRDEEGRWASVAEIMGNRGLVPYGGEWISPGERAARQEERKQTAALRAEQQRLEAEARSRWERVRRQKSDEEGAPGSNGGPSSSEVALASIRLAEKAVERGRELGHGHFGSGFLPSQALVIPSLPLSGGVQILIPAPGRDEASAAQVQAQEQARFQDEMEALIKRQPGSILSVQSFVQQPRRPR